MKRSDITFAASLLVIGSFVAIQAVRANAASSHGSEVSTTSFGSSEVIPEAKKVVAPELHAAAPPVDSVVVPVGDAAADVRRRLQQYSQGTYISEVLLAHDSSIVRWPDRRGTPLRVWVQDSPVLSDWNPDNVALVREAFISWSEAGVPLNFTFVLDSANADIHVTWIDRFAEQISGKTLWTHDDHWWIVGADILLALHHRAGETLDAASISAISLHEVGHLVGLDHTSDTTAIMAPRVQVRDLSEADRATAQLVYSVSPGSIRRGSRLPAQRNR